MSMSDPIADLLTRIRNAQMVAKPTVSIPSSKVKAAIAQVLKDEGYIRGYTETAFENGKSEFEIELKYFDGQPVIAEIARVSKPGRRVYSSVGELPRVADGLGVTIVSTPQGVMADHNAREQNVGGEILCRVV